MSTFDTVALTNAVLGRAFATAGLPVLSFSVGDPTDRSTWIFQMAAGATPAQTAAAQSIVNTVVIDNTLESQRRAQDFLDAMPVYQKAIILALIDQLNVIRAALPTPLSAITPAQALSAIRTKAGTL